MVAPTGAAVGETEIVGDEVAALAEPTKRRTHKRAEVAAMENSRTTCFAGGPFARIMASFSLELY